MKIFTLLLTALICSNGLSQRTTELRAKVLDQEGNKVEFGNAALISEKDSSIIKGGLVSDGQLSITGITLDKGLLLVKAIGFLDYYQSISGILQDSIIELDDIVLSTNDSLATLNIVDYKPAFSRDGDKIIVDVENSGMAASGTVIDLLRKAPGVMVDANNNVSIYGRGAARLYIDGQLITSNSLLQSIPSQDVKEIQVIKNPGAEFDAEGGGGVINIITKSNNLEGVNGTLFGGSAHGRKWFHSGGGRINYKKGKWNTYAMLNNFWGQRGSSNDYFRTIYQESGDVYFDNEIETVWRNRINTNLRVGVDYSIDSLSTIGFQYKALYNDRITNAENTNLIFDDSSTLSSLQTSTESHSSLVNNGFNLRYRYKNDSTGHVFLTSADYSKFSSANRGTIFENIVGVNANQNDKQSDNQNNIHLFTAKLDHEYHWKKKFSLSSGLKHYTTGNNSSNIFQQLENNQWENDTNLTSGYRFKENVSAIYTQFTFNSDKLNIRTGLRGELTSTAGTSSETIQLVIDTLYFNLFPTAYFGYNVNKDLVLGLNYLTRFSRPSFQDLNPFVEYIDSVSAFIGNPFMRPSYTHRLQLSATYMEYASIELAYNRTENEVLTFVDRTPSTNAFIVQDRNNLYSESFNLDITLPYETKMWTTYNGFGYNLAQAFFEDQGTIKTLKRDSYYFYLYNELRLPGKWSIQATFWYSSPGLEGIFEYGAIHGLEATITKKMLDDKLVVSFVANDILNSYVEQGKSVLDGFVVNYRDRYDTHFFRLNLTYNFGKLKSPDYRDKSGNAEEFNRIEQD